VQKFAAIEKVIAEFKRKHGRVPSFWLDKVCIDQSKITETLRALPIFLVSCTGMLIVAGPTYVHRLWCIWEVHMLFVASGGAKPMLEVESIRGASSGSGPGLAEKIAAFALDEAHCYDPNEERRLRAAIAAAPGGAPVFESKIRGIADGLQRICVPAARAAPAQETRLTLSSGVNHSAAVDGDDDAATAVTDLSSVFL
jgi:hypothetical protein